jgi:hypothetical protein
MNIVMVSPAGRSNARLETSIEECKIERVDEPSEARAEGAPRLQ